MSFTAALVGTGLMVLFFPGIFFLIGMLSTWDAHARTWGGPLPRRKWIILTALTVAVAVTIWLVALWSSVR